MDPIVSLDSRSGFTLIEFSIAVLIMMVGLLGLLQTVNMASQHNLQSLLRNEAISVADEQMVLTKSSINDSTKFVDLASSSSLVNRKARGSFANYSVNRTITETSVNSKEVTIRVTWRYKGSRFNHLISTLILNPTPIYP